MTHPWALLGPRRELQVIDGSGRRWSPSGWPNVLWGSWALASEQSAYAHSWPTWSPDRECIACFRQARGTEPGPHVFLSDPDGACATELPSLGMCIPIYLQWSPDGRRLAVLTQERDRLVLHHAEREGDQLHRMQEGSPLFFTWTGPHTLVTFLGNDDGPQLREFHVGADETRQLAGVPGNFCTPVRVAERLVYVAHHDQQLAVWSLADGEDAPVALEPVAGLVALVPSPSGRWLARAVASDAFSSYKRLGLLDPCTGEERPLSNLALLAFFWLPMEDGLVVVEQKGPRVTWSRMELDGSVTPLHEHAPTRDLAFYLRFFEQFCSSHPLISPSGDALLVPGTPPDAPKDAVPQIWRVPLDGKTPEVLTEGVLAVFPAAMSEMMN